MSELAIEIRGLRKSFKADKGEVAAIDGIDLTVSSGEFMCLLGPSGCGKTTTLRSIAGLERPDSGFIKIGDQVVYDSSSRHYVATEDRGLGMVFQSYAIWPHMNVYDNVAYPLKRGKQRGKYSRGDLRDRVHAMLEVVGCGGLARRFPGELSGGQQQRVALARSLVYEPSVMLFDEPLSNLDAKLRERMRFELRAIQSRVGFTAIYVTHDQEEALTMSDRIAIMANGQIRQLAPPEVVYEAPEDGFVADFIGTANVLSIIDAERVDEGLVSTALGLLRFGQRSARTLSSDGRMQVVFRPEHLKVVPLGATDEQNTFSGCITGRAYRGDAHVYTVSVGTKELRLVDPTTAHRLDVGDPVAVFVSPENCRLIPSGESSPPVRSDTSPEEETANAVPPVAPSTVV